MAIPETMSVEMQIFERAVEAEEEKRPLKSEESSLRALKSIMEVFRITYLKNCREMSLEDQEELQTWLIKMMPRIEALYPKCL